MALYASGRPRISMSIDPSRVWLGETTPGRSDRAVDAFWAWWCRDGSRDAFAALESGDISPLVPEITSLIEAIDSGLSWEFSQRGVSRIGSPRYRLTVTAAGVPALRGAARRWLAGAPPADETWSYSDLRDPVNCSSMTFRGRRLTVDETELSVEAGLSLLNLRVHHPGFVELDPDDRRLAAYLLLDAVVGEAAVETWVGRIEACHEPAEKDAHPLTTLPQLIQALRDDNADEMGDPAWQILHGDTPRGPLVAMVRTPLVALSAPQFDQHVAVRVTYSDRVDCGLPGSYSLPQLRDFEDFLSERILGSGECVAAESCDGERILHFYVDSRTPASEQLRAALGGWSQGPVGLEVNDDPGWERVQHLRV